MIFRSLIIVGELNGCYGDILVYGKWVKRRNGGGDVVVKLTAELVVVMVMSERHWPGLFIGWPWRCQRRDLYPDR